jgi:hypothetical protein
VVLALARHRQTAKAKRPARGARGPETLTSRPGGGIRLHGVRVSQDSSGTLLLQGLGLGLGLGDDDLLHGIIRVSSDEILDGEGLLVGRLGSLEGDLLAGGLLVLGWGLRVRRIRVTQVDDDSADRLGCVLLQALHESSEPTVKDRALTGLLDSLSVGLPVGSSRKNTATHHLVPGGKGSDQPRP